MKTAIELKKIRIDGGTQMRAEIDSDTVLEYAERIAAGDTFPHPVVFNDGVDNWLAEGFHRYHSSAAAGKKQLICDVRTGTKRDAVLFACGANGTNGLRRKNADKRLAVETLLADAEWSKLGDGKVADLCLVSAQFVSNIRKGQVPTVGTSTPRTREGRDGKQYPVAASKTKPSPAPSTAPEPTQDATHGSPCPNCQGTERDADGDCAKCHEPLGTPAAKPKPKQGRELIPAKSQKAAEHALKVLERFFDLIERHSEFAAALDHIGRGVRNE